MKVLLNIMSLVFIFYSITTLPVSEDKDDGDNIISFSQSEVYIPRKNKNDQPVPTSREETYSADVMKSRRTSRAAVVRNESLHWPDATITYVIEGFSASERAMILKAIRTWEFWTCIRFVPLSPTNNQTDYVAIVSRPGLGCSSFIGRMGGRQEMYLESPKCTKTIRDALHELMHVMGAIDEHRRPNRDDHITIHEKYILKDKLPKFEKYSNSSVTDFGIHYDYSSILHYHKYIYRSEEFQKTIDPKILGAKLGWFDRITVRDAMTIMKMYDCNYKTFNISNTDFTSRILPNYNDSPLSKKVLYNMYFRNISYIVE